MATAPRSKAANFAHLLGRAAAKKSKAEEDDRKDDEEEEKDKDEAESDEPEKEDDDEKGKKSGKRAEDDDDDAEASEDDDDDDKERAELTGSSPAAKARRRERARCAAIFASPHAAGRPEVAANFAFNTCMTAQEAVGVMASLGPVKPQRAALVERMQAVKNPDVGADAPAGGPQDEAGKAAARIIAANQLRLGEK